MSAPLELGITTIPQSVRTSSEQAVNRVDIWSMRNALHGGEERKLSIVRSDRRRLLPACLEAAKLTATYLFLPGIPLPRYPSEVHDLQWIGAIIQDFRIDSHVVLECGNVLESRTAWNPYFPYWNSDLTRKPKPRKMLVYASSQIGLIPGFFFCRIAVTIACIHYVYTQRDG